MKKAVQQTVILLALSTIVVISISLIIKMLQDKLIQGKEPRYETRHNYPLGVDRVEYDKIWYGDDEYEEDDELYYE
ncbi:hypothetical protein IWQ47_003482 [Aquimarina sp. EL_43]|uniref:hypothetical protein n=1 Tax=unclassified Aquimarina TaxID=2627091 RepID=UPI0018CA178B|nr:MULTISPECIES: hypothetical protein [unclassified Aquimarina]MBG6131776.1 hypothetical protein [Aquimarina sp. EL_35]MBG6149340.1 hypothetical protein [Aquimarina sp. EL_32]MBG6170397.1 hypothetical protein [Aquimarina sp. EL_43]